MTAHQQSASLKVSVCMETLSPMNSPSPHALNCPTPPNTPLTPSPATLNQSTPAKNTQAHCLNDLKWLQQLEQRLSQA
jgi:hypothetical protein